jgi:serine/threonine-protein kinase
MAIVGRYELCAQLASGNTGYVYSARMASGGDAHPAYAVKLIKPRLAKEQRYSQLLLTEAPAATTFEHPSSVRIFEIGNSDSELYVAMERVEGQTLHAVLQRSISDRRPLSPEVALFIARRVAGVLELAHRTSWCEGESRGICHGEVSPQSILIGYDGQVKLTGVGIGRARICLPPARARLPYRAPELFERPTLTDEADIYGLGVVLYEGLAHKSPFLREQVNDTRQAILDNVFMPIGVECPDVAGAIDELVQRMMARNPRERPRSMSEVEDVIRAVMVASDDDMTVQLSEEMRILFAEEQAELSMSQGWVPRTPHEAAAPWEEISGTSQSGSGTISPTMPPKSSSTPKASPAHKSTATGLYDEFEVDQLVDAIVAASSAARGQSGDLPKMDSGEMEFVRMMDVVRPREASSKPAPKESAFAHALEDGSSEFDVDQLVDAIVHASAKAREPQPHPEARRSAPSSGIRESMHQGAIVDIAENPRSTRKPKLSPDEPSSTPEPTSPIPGQSAIEYRETSEAAEEGTVPEQTLLKAGEIVGNRYRVVDKLGIGGMAVVYKVQHLLLEKMLALKLLRPELSMIPYVVQRFQREARCVSQLDDPHIVRVTDFGRADDGALFLVMELIEGEPLSHRLETEGAMALEPALEIMDQVLSALDHAHKNNVVHRDLKPDNIMLVKRNGRPLVKLVDFGIAKLAGDDALSQKPLTQAGMVFGSPRYMSPEQANGEAVDGRADIYAAGTILYEMLTGKRPFDGKSANAVFSRLLTQPPPAMELLGMGQQRAAEIERVIFRALEKDKEARFQSAAEFRDALAEAAK